MHEHLLLRNYKSGLCSLTERRFGLRREAGKRGCVLGGDVREDLAIELDAGLFQSADERAVTHAVMLGGCADADDPDGAVLALLLFASEVGEFQAAFDGFFG